MEDKNQVVKMLPVSPKTHLEFKRIAADFQNFDECLKLMILIYKKTAKDLKVELNHRMK